MPYNKSKNEERILEAADTAAPRITPAQAGEMINKGSALVVDLRDASDLKTGGKVAGALHVSRGMLAFRADPDMPYHDENFSKDRVVILYCASGRSSEGGCKLLKDMGYCEVYDLGSFENWVASGGAIEL